MKIIKSFYADWLTWFINLGAWDLFCYIFLVSFFTAALLWGLDVGGIRSGKRAR